MDIPEDLGQRIAAAARLAVSLHLQQALLTELFPGGTGENRGGATISIGRADLSGLVAKDGDFPAAPSFTPGTECEAA